MNMRVAHVLAALIFSSSSSVFAQDAAVATSAPEVSAHQASVTVFGDIRQRYEQVENETAGVSKEYDHARLRARLGVKAKPLADLNVEMRVATGTGGPSTNQSYGDGTKGMRNYDFKLDRAYFKWTPKFDVALMGGRMASPFQSVGDNDLVWDSDVNFDGTALGWGKKFGGVEVFAAVGSFMLEETKDSAGTDITLKSAQLGSRAKFMDKFSAGLILSHHTFAGTRGRSGLASATEFSGNSNTGTAYSYNYEVFAPGVEFGFDFGIPVVVFYEMIENSRVDSENKGSIVGVKINKAKAEGDWQLTIDQRELERDSTVGAFTDGDSFGGGVNGKSLRASATYMVKDAIGVAVTSFTGEKNIASGQTASDRNRMQLDLNFKF